LLVVLVLVAAAALAPERRISSRPAAAVGTRMMR
jgi:hypothetical protein